jgi:predicted nucleic acid-binding protein
MQYLLDTNAWIMYLKDPDSEVRKRLLTVSPQD